ncbi:titin-like [Oncorhynchus masou masou]|uniref:titin-like n=1 Tax=Oncorhynchus masou masou TaxID=90313 RepID=UPI0031831A70
MNMEKVKPWRVSQTRATDPFTVPAAPTDVEITSITSETMTICWKRPESDGGSSISGYVIEKREKLGMRWAQVNTKPVNDLRVKASNLCEGCEYEYRVYAENVAGLSPPSIPCKLTKAEDPQFLPSPPAKPKVIDSTKTSVTLSWNKPLFDGGAAVTGYCVEYKRTDEEDWFVGVSNTENTESTVVGLTPGAEYIFVVKSINKIGVSEPSPPTDPQAAEDREEKPQFNISNEMRKTLLVKDGSSFTLTVPFSGKPFPNVMWDKADVDLRVRASIHTTGYRHVYHGGSSNKRRLRKIYSNFTKRCWKSHMYVKCQGFLTLLVHRVVLRSRMLPRALQQLPGIPQKTKVVLLSPTTLLIFVR